MMHCEQIQELLDQYLDGQLGAEDQQRLEDHLSHCEACANLCQICKDLRKDEGEVPEHFAASWRKAVRREDKMENKRTTQNSFRNILAIAAALVFVIGGTMITRDQPASLKNNDVALYANAGPANNSAAGATFSLKRSAVTEETSYAETAEGYDLAAGADQAAERQQKLIRHVDFTIRTLEFDQVIQNLQSLTLSNNGRIEFVSQFGDHTNGELRNASLTLRIPSEKLDAFLNEADKVGNISSFTSRVEDVTETYYDVQSRLDTQLKKMARLQELLLQAEEMSDLLQIESSIADTQYMIDSYQARLKGMNDDVDYSTVSVYVQETRVVEAEEASFIRRIGAGIADSVSDGVVFLGDAVVFILSLLPWLIVLIVIVVVVKLVRKKRK